MNAKMNLSLISEEKIYLVEHTSQENLILKNSEEDINQEVEMLSKNKSQPTSPHTSKHFSSNNNENRSSEKIKSKSSITITRASKNNEPIKTNINMSRIYETAEEMLTCLIERDQDPTSSINDEIDDDEENPYETLSPQYHNKKSHYQTLKHIQIIPKNKSHHKTFINEKNSDIRSPNQIDIERSFSNDSYHTLHDDNIDPALSPILFEMREPDFTLDKSTSCSSILSLDIGQTTRTNTSGKVSEKNSTNSEFQSIEEFRSVVHDEQRENDTMHTDLRVPNDFYPPSSQLLPILLVEPLDSSFIPPLRPRRSLRLIEKHEKNLAREAELEALRNLPGTSAQLAGNDPQRKVLRRRKKSKKVKKFVHKSTQTDEDEILANVNSTESLDLTETPRRRLTFNQTRSNSKRTASTVDSEAEKSRRSKRTFEKRSTSSVNILRHENNRASQLNPIQTDGNHLDINRNQANNENISQDLFQTSFDPLDEPMELPVTQDDENHSSNDEQFNVNQRNITLRRNHPAHTKNKNRNKSNEAANNDYEHLNTANITVRRGKDTKRNKLFRKSGKK